jgi:hypothetical protein
LVASTDGDLMVTDVSINTDEEVFVSSVTKIVSNIFTSWNEILEWQGDIIQLVVRDAHVPDKIFDVNNVLLVRFELKNTNGASRTIPFVDPALGEEDFLLF